MTAAEITEAVKDLALKANFELGGDVLAALEEAEASEESPIGRRTLATMRENAGLAREKRLPLCQDTGSASVFLDLGQDLRVEGDLTEAVEEGIRRGYREGDLRKSIVADPLFKRANTGDNTPPFLHVRVVTGESISITVMPKGAGCDNASRLVMFRPTTSMETIKSFVLSVVADAGPGSCPPLVVGLGIGGTFDTAGGLAKRALLRPLGERNQDSRLAALEDELLSQINGLGIGPAGFGGRTTALKVAIDTFPTHMASLPVAVNLSCHSLRRAQTQV